MKLKSDVWTSKMDIAEVTVDIDFKTYAKELENAYKAWREENKKYYSYLTEKILSEYCPSVNDKVQNIIVEQSGLKGKNPQIRVRWPDLYYVMQEAGIEIPEVPFLKLTYEPIFPIEQKKSGERLKASLSDKMSQSMQKVIDKIRNIFDK